MATGAARVIFTMTWVLLATMATRPRDEVLQPPMITNDWRHPVVYVEPEFHTYTVQCRANGKPSPRYTWERNGESIYTSTQFEINSTSGHLTLILSNIPALDKGTYRCVASNMYGRAVSDILTIIKAGIEKKPDLPVDAWTPNQYNYSFITCHSPLSYPDGEFRWFISDGAGTSNLRVQDTERTAIDKKGTLHFLYVDLDDDPGIKYYKCGVYNKLLATFGVGSLALASVTPVTEAPKRIIPWTVLALDVVALEGTDAVLECIFAAYPLVTEITWFDANGTQINHGLEYEIRPRLFGRRLVVKVVSLKHEGHYLCKGTNVLGRSMAKIFLNVTAAPKWLTLPKSATVAEGQNASFNCLATAFPGEAVGTTEWFINGKPLSDVKVQHKFLLNTDHTRLTVLNVTKPEDLMNVQCNISSSTGYVYKDVYLNVIKSIRIVANTPRKSFLWTDKTLELYIKAESDPSTKMQYLWSHNNNVIQPTDSSVYTLNNDMSLTIDARDLNTTQLEQLTGTYTVRIYHLYEETFYSFLVEKEASYQWPNPSPNKVVSSCSKRPSLTLNQLYILALIDMMLVTLIKLAA